ncbi:MAG: GNAT family N-acetyltransferase [Betaproteobacteria bacterium]|jgi:predicted GNAT family N-acyltransferase|nr:GNAT family N-acetyltransferase [Betaproteobacteria bacterium]
MDSLRYELGYASWLRDAAALQAVRRQVFVEEQGVPEQLEWDEWDAVSLHVLAQDAAGQAIGTGRLLPDGHVGRMAVVRDWRKHGVGGALLDALLDAARARGLAEIALNAQTHALGFYARRGFLVEGDEFDDAGIPHRRMRLRL